MLGMTIMKPTADNGERSRGHANKWRPKEWAFLVDVAEATLKGNQSFSENIQSIMKLGKDERNNKQRRQQRMPWAVREMLSQAKQSPSKAASEQKRRAAHLLWNRHAKEKLA